MTETPSCPICGDAGTCDVCDNPPMTAEEIANLKPFAEVLPRLADTLRKAGRPKSDTPKVSISIRLDADVVEKFKATGPGWQTRMNAALRAARV